MGSCAIGIDVGGAYIKLVALDDVGRVWRKKQVATSTEGPPVIVPRLVEEARLLAGELDIASVGVAVPGVVDMARGVVEFVPNIPGNWDDLPLAHQISEALRAPTLLLNDVRAATYGELHYGAGRGVQNFIMVAVGTGIGGGIVAGGDLLLGSNGRAGEVGHQVIDVHGPHCGCGNSGCVESLASGPAIATEAARLVLQGIPTGLREACNGDVSRITPRLVAHTAAAGDAKAREIIEQEAERLGILAANLTLVLNPERIIVGGGVSLIGEPLLEGMRRTIAARIGWYTRRAPVDVVAAALGEEAGAMGAAAWGRAKA